MESKLQRFITHQSFFSAVRSGDLRSLQEVLDNLTQLDPSDGSSSISDLMSLQNDAGQIALYVAAENDLHHLFTYLLRFCDVQTVKIRSKADMNAFHVAAKKGHLGNLSSLHHFVFPNQINSSELYVVFEEHC